MLNPNPFGRIVGYRTRKKVKNHPLVKHNLHLASRILNYIFVAFPLLFCYGCAKQGYPEGGPRDVQPPTCLGAVPSSGALHFDGKQFVLHFDEYFVLKDVENNVIVSPPFKHKPQYSVKGRDLVVTWNDTLRPDMTYLFQFKEAIADFTEGNVLSSVDYAFSTGDIIDSLTLCGRVVDAFSHEAPEKVCAVYLFDADADDSVISKALPRFNTRTNKSGYFRFANLPQGRYRLVAIDDADRDYHYNPSEAIAFLDTVVSPAYMPQFEAKGDSAKHKTLDTAKVFSRMLYMSLGDAVPQHVVDAKFLQAGVAQIITAKPMQEPRLSTGDSVIYHLHPGHDTITLWTLNPQCRVLRLPLWDSTGVDDTLSLRFTQKRAKRGTGASKSSQQWVSWSVASPLGFFQRPALRFSVPVADSIPLRLDSAVAYLSLPDSHLSHYPLLIDSSRLSAVVPVEFKGGEQFQLTFPARRLANIFGESHDTLRISSKVQGPESYGVISIGINAPDADAPVMVQLLSDNKVVDEQRVSAQGTALFPNRTPGEYKVRAFVDYNDNGHWDAGNYYQHRQPEPVYYFSKTLKLRQNWEIKELWQMSDAK